MTVRKPRVGNYNTRGVRYESRRLFDAATMHQIGNHPQERALFYWEKDEVSDAFVWRGPGLGFMGPTCSCGRH